jgi:hypothetical protein
VSPSSCVGAGDGTYETTATRPRTWPCMATSASLPPFWAWCAHTSGRISAHASRCRALY